MNQISAVMPKTMDAITHPTKINLSSRVMLCPFLVDCMCRQCRNTASDAFKLLLFAQLFLVNAAQIALLSLLVMLLSEWPLGHPVSI